MIWGDVKFKSVSVFMISQVSSFFKFLTLGAELRISTSQSQVCQNQEINLPLTLIDDIDVVVGYSPCPFGLDRQQTAILIMMW